MKNKVLYIILAVLVLALLGLYIYGKSQTQNPVVEANKQAQNSAPILNNQDNSNKAEPNSNSNLNTNTDKPSNNSNDNSQGKYSDESDIQNGDTAVQEIVYDGAKFTPSSLTIKKGDIVIFKNEGEKGFWPASGPHPQHTNYPEFDAKASVAPGKSFQFKFEKVGSWPFHDHLNSSAYGNIKVTE